MNNYRDSVTGEYVFYEECHILKEIIVEIPEVIINYYSKIVVYRSKYLTIIG